MKLSRVIGYFVIIFISVKCSAPPQENESTDKLFKLLTPEHTGIHFSNMIYETTELNIITFEYLYNGAGVGIGDFDNDGLQDIYFAGNMEPGKLYLNKGRLKFEDVTERAKLITKGKWGTGVNVVDINNDGWLDLYLSFAGPYGSEKRENELYINNGDLTFTESAKQYGLADNSHTTHTAFFDYDNDGDLDVYLLNNITDRTGPNIIRPKRNNGEMPNTDRLYRNDNGYFSNVSAEAGILKEGYGLGVAIGDINQDGWADIYVSNDYLSNDLLYLNNQDGTFTDVAKTYFKHTSYSSMGCDLADYNNDGLLDIVAVDMLPPDNTRRKLMIASINYDRYKAELANGYFPQYMRNTLQWNQGKNKGGKIVFSEIGSMAGIQSTDWSWSPLLQDIDNDGLKDLLITNGYPRDITNMDFATYKANKLRSSNYNNNVMLELIKEVNNIEGAYLPNYAFKNTGNLTFEDHSYKWGFEHPSFSHGAAVADLDNDGDLDYITNNSYDKVFVYENQTQNKLGNHFLRIKLKGSDKNLSAIGAKVWLYQKDKVQFLENFPFRGYQSSIEHHLHFGLGKNPEVDSLVILWPNKAKQTIEKPNVDEVLTLRQTDRNNRAKPMEENVQPLFMENNLVVFEHSESEYPDFKLMPILPMKHSQEGPQITTGDVNGDGLEDFFIGGAAKKQGQLFIQQPNSTFISKPLDSNHANLEDIGCLLFDADQDGDLDLFVGSGSSEFLEKDKFEDRLYRNDGKGNFSFDDRALPKLKSFNSCVKTADFDRDGDLDLFVGGRMVPGNYGSIPESYLLENRGGNFYDVTTERVRELGKIGMVTDAQWSDLNQDGWEDLVICGEWMPITVFKNNNGQLVNETTNLGLEKTIGWWNKIAIKDLDNDGDLDFVLGNLGLNHQYNHSKEKPVALYLNDFDDNGKLDPIIVHYLQDRQVPIHFRKDLLDWIFPLKKQFQTYQIYAETNWESFFSNRNTEPTIIDTFKSSWVENLGNGKFKLHALPIETQTAPIYGILIDDFNLDNLQDILLIGNTTAPNSFEGQYDALNGLLLLGENEGEGKVTFRAATIADSGFYVPGEGRSLAKIKLANGKQLILAAQSNGRLKTYEYREKLSKVN